LAAVNTPNGINAVKARINRELSMTVLRVIIVGMFIVKHVIFRLSCICCGVCKPQKNCCLITFAVLTLICAILGFSLPANESKEFQGIASFGKVNRIFSIATDLILFFLVVLLYKKLPSFVELTLSKIAEDRQARQPRHEMMNHQLTYQVPYQFQPVQGVVVGQPVAVGQVKAPEIDVKKSIDF
jgi:hypothetical protein